MPLAENTFGIRYRDHGDIFGGEIVAIGSHPICHIANAVTHPREFPLGLILVAGAEQDHGVREDRAALRHVVDLEAGLAGTGFDTADKVLPSLLPEVEVLMALIVTIHYAGLSGREYLVDKGAFIPLAVGEENFSGDGVVEVKPQVHLGLFGTLAVVGPSLGEHGVDQGTVNGGQVSPGSVFLGQGLGGLSCNPLKNIESLLQAPGVDGFARAAPTP
jgi:hypothetical protein